MACVYRVQCSNKVEDVILLNAPTGVLRVASEVIIVAELSQSQIGCLLDVSTWAKQDSLGRIKLGAL